MQAGEHAGHPGVRDALEDVREIDFVELVLGKLREILTPPVTSSPGIEASASMLTKPGMSSTPHPTWRRRFGRSWCAVIWFTHPAGAA